ncbi:MAG: hypothetical protein AUK27_11835 [Deltaproteobacteria bacterium CG2_30_66_27]|nr:MAG: hypothetical protein AUK27_11835 [Deltaproteobacteria bacterium CG2_30_66_27]PJB32966.1 MAG: DUF2169 domain-containing protein [Deltaproteobacteria bacterium CG_4_9_14_3_um_filter_65_9]
MKIGNETPFEAEALPFLDPEGKAVLTVIVKGTFTIVPEGVAAVAEAQIPILFGDEPTDPEKGGSPKFEADTAPFKPRADILLVGKAHAPGGTPVRWLDAGLRVGTLQKVVRVSGDRAWISGAGKLSAPVSTEPEPFTEMSLVYEKAFGGIDTESGGFCAENPVGCGFYTRKSPRNIDGAPLPNIEDASRPIRSWTDHPGPAGFGCLGKGWAPRVGYLGTYDELWKSERSPLPPNDFRYDFYNAAPPALQVEGYLRGDEEILLLNLEKSGKVRFRLPGIAPVATVEKTERWSGPSWSEPAPMRLDTLCLLPDEGRLFLVWRGRCPLTDLSALEVETVRIVASTP